MLTIRKSSERGDVNMGWLHSKHSFSFGHYHDPRHMGFRSLRVINEDRVAPGGGFPEHPHHDMEIISYVLSGTLAHQDSLGNVYPIRPGDVQRMSAGEGIEHSEFNHSKTEPVHFLQIWIRPDRKGAKADYDQKHYPRESRLNTLRLVASPTGNDGSISINQDASVFASLLEKGKTLQHTLASGRHAWIQLATGSISVNGQTLGAGDAIAVSEEAAISVVGLSQDAAEFLLFDLN
jgi:redox-sensitive bicupin YhaK (pirin superfamily)